MLYVVAGPTASGKTAAAVALAKKINGEIINADSMQVYKGLDIGTAKPTTAEQSGIPHHLLDVARPDEPFSAAKYQHLARKAIADIKARGRVPILAGGTGFYINAVVYDMDFHEEGSDDTALREQYAALAVEKNIYSLHKLLRERDPPAAEAIHPRNVKRVARALAFIENTGMLFSAHNEAQREKKRKHVLPEGIVFVVLDQPRPILYERINTRVHQMLAAGLEREVAGLLKAGYTPDLPAMSGIGYKETANMIIHGADLRLTAEKIQQATRNYAKRQITWFKHNAPHARWLDASGKSAEALAEEII
jgi:tRNA dimethylallyltransferase